LYKTDPYYWTPTRLANLFDIDAPHVRGLLWEAKLSEEAMEAGDILEPEDALAIDWKYYTAEKLRKIETGQIPLNWKEFTSGTFYPFPMAPPAPLVPRKPQQPKQKKKPVALPVKKNRCK